MLHARLTDPWVPLPVLQTDGERPEEVKSLLLVLATWPSSALAAHGPQPCPDAHQGCTRCPLEPIQQQNQGRAEAMRTCSATPTGGPKLGRLPCLPTWGSRRLATEGPAAPAPLGGVACLPQPPQTAPEHWRPGRRARLIVQRGQGTGMGRTFRLSQGAWLLRAALLDSHLGVKAGGRLCSALKVGTSILGTLSEGLNQRGVQ